MNSLKKRLSLGMASSLAVFFLLQTVMIGSEIETLSEDNLISRLSHDQEQILAALEWPADAAVSINPSQIPRIYQRPFSGHYFQIAIDGQLLRSRSLWDEKLPKQQKSIARDIEGPQHQRLLVLKRTVMQHKRKLHILVAENITPIERTTVRFQWHLLLFAAAAVLALLLFQNLLINRALKPLSRIRQQVSRLDKGEIPLLDAADVPEEISPLVEEVNQLLRILQRRLQSSRNALTDLAHSLKTPLTVARQIAERQPDDALLDRQLQHIELRINHELTQARTAGPMPGDHWTTARQDIADIVDMLGQVYPHISITQHIDETSAAPLDIPANREDMLELLGNLLENACKWGQDRVCCRLSRNKHGTHIRVEDNGPGIAPNIRARILARGTRADESVPGHGLGLSIVARIVDAYDGELKLTASPKLSGLMVDILLP